MVMLYDNTIVLGYISFRDMQTESSIGKIMYKTLCLNSDNQNVTKLVSLIFLCLILCLLIQVTDSLGKFKEK